MKDHRNDCRHGIERPEWCSVCKVEAERHARSVLRAEQEVMLCMAMYGDAAPETVKARATLMRRVEVVR